MRYNRTNGSAINQETLDVIRHAQESRGVIVLTDPDFPGDKIRHTIRDNVPGVKHAYLDKERQRTEEVKLVLNMRMLKTLEALMHVSSPFEEAEETIDKSVLIDLGLIIGKDADADEILGRKLHIGHSNGKQLLKS